MNQTFFCLHEGHENEEIVGLCLNIECKSAMQCCLKCSQSKPHKDHASYIKSIVDIQDLVKGQKDMLNVKVESVQTSLKNITNSCTKQISYINKQQEQLSDLEQISMKKEYSELKEKVTLKQWYCVGQKESELSNYYLLVVQGKTLEQVNHFIEQMQTHSELIAENFDYAGEMNDIKITKKELSDSDIRNQRKKKAKFPFPSKREWMSFFIPTLICFYLLYEKKSQQNQNQFQVIQNQEIYQQIYLNQTQLDQNQSQFIQNQEVCQCQQTLSQDQKTMRQHEDCEQVSKNISIMITGLGFMLRKSNHTMIAERYFYIAYLIDKDNYDALCYQGKCLQSLQNFTGAIEIYTEVLSNQPNHIKANDNMGYCLYRLGKQKKDMKQFQEAEKYFEDAIQYFNKAIKVSQQRDSDKYWYYENRGDALLEIGQKEQAIQDYQMALQKNPADPNRVELKIKQSSE